MMVNRACMVVNRACMMHEQHLLVRVQLREQDVVVHGLRLAHFVHAMRARPGLEVFGKNGVLWVASRAITRA